MFKAKPDAAYCPSTVAKADKLAVAGTCAYERVIRLKARKAWSDML